MKGNGLSSTHRALLKKVNRQNSYASAQEGYLAAKERQKSLQMQAAKAQFERNQRELEKAAAADTASPSPDVTVSSR